MRPSLAIVALCMAVSSTAHAADLYTYDGNGDASPDVLIPDDAWPSWLARGTGSPTVTYDPSGEQWIMLFEARFTEDYLDTTGQDWSACQPRPDGPRVVWGIGRATSADGIDDWVIDAEPLILPEPGTWRSCSTSHPFVVRTNDGFHLYFKAEQGFNPCTDGEPEPAWGCGRMTGVGYASSVLGERFSVAESDEPMITIGEFGFPTAVTTQAEDAPIEDQAWTMLLTRADGVYLARSSDAGENWSLEPGNPVLEPGTWTFAQDEWFQPTLTCSPVDETFPLVAWIGGRSSESGDAIDGLNAIDGSEWVGDGSPEVTFEDAVAWRHWDAIRLGDEVYFYYTIRGDDQRLRVSLAKLGDDASFDLDGSLDVGRSCLYGERPEDTDTGTDNTDNTDDTDGPGETDDTDDDGNCYCSTGANPATWPLAAGVVLLGLMRRRRR